MQHHAGISCNKLGTVPFALGRRRVSAHVPYRRVLIHAHVCYFCQADTRHISSADAFSLALRCVILICLIGYRYIKQAQS
ncbi:hypothetical protein FKM82_027561 [Ascaphus truei]